MVRRRVDVGRDGRIAALPTLTSRRQVNVGRRGERRGLPTLTPACDATRPFDPLPYPAGVDVRAGAGPAPHRPPPSGSSPPRRVLHQPRRVPEPAQLRRVAAEQRARPSSPSPAAPGARAPASARGGRCGRGTTPGSRASGCRACSPPPGGGPCRRTRRASGSGTGGRGRACPAARGRRCPPRPWPGAATCWAVGGEGLPLPPDPGSRRRRRSPTRRGGPRPRSTGPPRSGRRRRAGARASRSPGAA